MTRLESHRRLAEPKEPYPFLPVWTARIGPLTERGNGLLSSQVRLQRALIDEFTIYPGTCQITVLPKLGEIYFDSQLSFKSVPGTQWLLLWSRTMSKAYGTWDANTAPAECEHYNIGLESSAGQVSYRLLADGTVLLK